MVQPDRTTDLRVSASVPASGQLSRRGANASINLLPTEILVEIFQVLAAPPESDDNNLDNNDEDDEEDSWREDSWRETKGCVEWFVVTEVCHYWYDVAIAMPTLWQVIDVYSHVEWLKLCLERSGASPIDVRFHDMNTVDSEDAEGLVVLHASRISKLYVLPGPDMQAWSSLHYLKNVSMPMLKEANVGGGSALEVDRSHHPALEVLRAYQFDVDWKRLSYEHLRVLDLESSVPTYEDRLPSLDAFLRILGRCQRLEELSLKHSIPLDTFVVGDENAKADYWSSSRIVSLPQLRKLDFVSGGITDVFAVLSHMQFTKSTSVKMWVGLFKELDDFRGLPGLLPQAPDAFPFLVDAASASIYYSKDLVFNVESSSGATLSIRYVMCAGGFVQDAYDPDDALFDFATIFSRAPLTKLNISYCTHFDTTLRTFRTFSCLRDLTVNLRSCKSDFTWLLSALRADAATGGSHNSDVVLPTLHTLYLRQTPWMESMIEDIGRCLEGRTMLAAAKLSNLTIEVAPGDDIPHIYEYESTLGHLLPFVTKDAVLFCYEA